MKAERDYVLGTHDAEIARLGLQHRVWRPRASDAWRRAGFGVGQTLLDIGCGPGYASLDLAEIVGPEGRIVALERSRRFLDSLEASARVRGLRNIEAVEMDLDEQPLPEAQADGAWSRWIYAFVKEPRQLLARVGARLRPGGAMVMHEYVDYRAWRLSPRSALFEGFVEAVIDSWRRSGGEPDIGLDLPRWLEADGFELMELRPIVEVTRPGDFVWEWPKAFIEVGLERLVELRTLTAERADGIRRAYLEAEATPGAFMITPTVIEILAKKM